jgi:hypothetical protein
MFFLDLFINMLNNLRFLFIFNIIFYRVYIYLLGFLLNECKFLGYSLMVKAETDNNKIKVQILLALLDLLYTFSLYFGIY